MSSLSSYVDENRVVIEYPEYLFSLPRSCSFSDGWDIERTLLPRILSTFYIYVYILAYTRTTLNACVSSFSFYTFTGFPRFDLSRKPEPCCFVYRSYGVSTGYSTWENHFSNPSENFLTSSKNSELTKRSTKKMTCIILRLIFFFVIIERTPTSIWRNLYEKW